MNKRISLMCSLIMVASFSSCAPTVTGANGQPYRADVKVGGLSAMVNRVALADLNDQTPATSYVELPQCTGGVISVGDVRRLGVETATRACNDAVKKTAGGVAGTALGIGVVLGGVVLFALKSIFNAVSHSY